MKFRRLQKALSVLLILVTLLSIAAPGVMAVENAPATQGETTATQGETTATQGETTATPGDTTATPGDTTATPGETPAGDTTATPGDTTATPGDTTATPGETPAGDTTATPGETPALLSEKPALLSEIPGTLDVSKGPIVITDSGYTQNSQTVTYSGAYTLTGTCNNTTPGAFLTVQGGTASKPIEITLVGDVTIDNTVGGGAAILLDSAAGATYVKLFLSGNDSSYEPGNSILRAGGTSAGIEMTGTATNLCSLVIDAGYSNSNGYALAVSGGNGGAGIGTGSSAVADGKNQITIGDTGSGSKKITATGGANAAGIGGGNGGSVEKITLVGENHEITAIGGANAAGIGGGKGGSVGTITLSGESNQTITATGGENAAGIGGGNGGSVGTITLTCSDTQTITATGGIGGPGIGPGPDGSCGAITISNGTVVATAPYTLDPVGGVTSLLSKGYAAGIGNALHATTASITINEIPGSGPTVTATGGLLSSGIGRSYDPENTQTAIPIEIQKRAIVTAYAMGDSYGRAQNPHMDYPCAFAIDQGNLQYDIIKKAVNTCLWEISKKFLRRELQMLPQRKRY